MSIMLKVHKSITMILFDWERDFIPIPKMLVDKDDDRNAVCQGGRRKHTFFAARHFSSNTSDFAQGLVHGLFVALMLATIVACVSMGVTLRNEEYLKKKYIEENDERNAEIANTNP